MSRPRAQWVGETESWAPLGAPMALRVSTGCRCQLGTIKRRLCPHVAIMPEFYSDSTVWGNHCGGTVEQNRRARLCNVIGLRWPLCLEMCFRQIEAPQALEVSAGCPGGDGSLLPVTSAPRDSVAAGAAGEAGPKVTAWVAMSLL